MASASLTKKAKKQYRRKIRLGGVLVSSPRFEKKADVDEWFKQMAERRKSNLNKVRGNYQVITFLEYAKDWMKKRVASYPQSTWASDDQRLRDYLLVPLGNVPLDRITKQMARSIILSAKDKKGKILSHQTKVRIRALLSKIMEDATSEDPPIIQLNPIRGVKFDTVRVAKHSPNVLETMEEVAEFIRIATELGPLERMYASLVFGGALRKSELLALKWGDVKWNIKIINIERHVEQVSLSIKAGTKSGATANREIPLADWLMHDLQVYRKGSSFASDENYILTDNMGNWIKPRAIADLHNRIAKNFGKKITPHELRHSFGRIFALTSGNMKALQAILGHASMSTTQIYSELTKSQLRPFGNVMNRVGDLRIFPTSEVQTRAKAKKARR